MKEILPGARTVALIALGGGAVKSFRKAASQLMQPGGGNCCLPQARLIATPSIANHHRPDRSILTTMKIATGKVVGGKVMLEGANFEEGESVTVIARDEGRSVKLTSEEEAELLRALVEADRGELVSAEEVLAKLARRHA